MEDNSESIISKKQKGGAKPSLTWDHFIAISERSPITHRRDAQCKYCNQKFTSVRLHDLKKHLVLKCVQISPEMRSIYIDELLQFQKEAEMIRNTLEFMNDQGETLGSKPSKRKSKGKELNLSDDSSSNKISKYYHQDPLDMISNVPLENDLQLTNGLKSEIDMAIVKWFATSSIPFSAIDNPFAIHLLKLLRGSYIPPSSDFLIALHNETAFYYENSNVSYQYQDLSNHHKNNLNNVVIPENLFADNYHIINNSNDNL